MYYTMFVRKRLEKRKSDNLQILDPKMKGPFDLVISIQNASRACKVTKRKGKLSHEKPNFSS